MGDLVGLHEDSFTDTLCKFLEARKKDKVRTAILVWVEDEFSDDENTPPETIFRDWYGYRIEAVGLCEFAKTKIIPEVFYLGTDE